MDQWRQTCQIWYGEGLQPYLRAVYELSVNQAKMATTRNIENSSDKLISIESVIK
jgi:hypothetical protein